MKPGNKTTGIRLRVVLEPDIAIGPGKADLLEGIRRTGSIAAAGREMSMSYKRAWTLVESMNECFKEPLVQANRGGNERGGAQLSRTGERVLETYRRMETQSRKAIARDMRSLRRLLADISVKK